MTNSGLVKFILGMAMCFMPLHVSGQTLTHVPEQDYASVLPGAGAAGSRVVSQLMWDAQAGALHRAMFNLVDVIGDPALQIVWQPDDYDAAATGATGTGRLIWLRKGAALYDKSAMVAVLQGQFVDGRIEGAGRYWHRSGTSYDGGWLNGEMSGQGRLQWANGDEFTGSFRAGLPDGTGEFISRDGSVYRGEFKGGSRDGPGTVYPATERAFRATWRAGVRIGQRDPITGQAGIAHLHEVQQSSFTDARLGVSVNRTTPPPYSPGEARLYDSFNSGSVLYVFTEGDFQDQWHGEAKTGLQKVVDFDPYDYHHPANFNLDFENASARPIQIVGGYLKVAQSQSDLDPMIAVGTSWDGRCSNATVTEVRFNNRGWSHPIDARINAGVWTPGYARLILPISGSVDASWPYSETEMEGALMNAGVNLPQLSAGGFACSADDRQGCLEQAKASGLFGPIADAVFLKGDLMYAHFGGTLDYEWRDIGGNLHSKSQRFGVDFKVGQIQRTAECGEGSDFASLFPNAIKLPTDQANYNVPFPMNATIMPGALSRWGFQIESDRATRHIFQVVFQLSDGREVISRTVDLNYFTPNDGRTVLSR